MFGIDGQEFLVIIVVLIVVVGPKDLPKMLRAFGKATARMRETAQEFRNHFDEAMRETEIKDLAHSLQDLKKLDPRESLTKILDPIRSVTDDLQAEIRKNTQLQDVSLPEEIVPPAEEKTTGQETEKRADA
ncbi:MAG: Sec-independent protein translocase protein TatB [Candidatus Tokpelaia hoelldobleri]|uniref:Sec-independent protein translocase protein TatB n=1 Tax=Candidatus Tokpelaia hoelldobleri TaxID=1902579 RepID=A0A1U9JU72_9HYPH|nr:MAG: Sec-independent protein translocase protein TatB [Candidatus Tokpelaia hoelldoblerii]